MVSSHGKYLIVRNEQGNFETYDKDEHLMGCKECQEMFREEEQVHGSGLAFCIFTVLMVMLVISRS